MKRFSFVLLMILAMSVCFSSCDKDDESGNGGSGNSPESLLIGKWQPVRRGSLGSLEDYKKDDILEFKANKTVTYNENGTYLHNYDGLALPILITQTTWSIRSVFSEWVLNFTEDDNPVRGFPYSADFNIEEITSTKLVLFNGFEHEFKRID